MIRCAMLLALGALLGGAAPAGTLRLPLDTPPALTSSFGEFRRGHYHGGLDFSTGGREGLAVHAPAPGWVYRVRASGIGYGRAVYFRLDDGRTVLFGHLSRYAPSVATAVEAEQDRRGSYEVDLYPEPHSLPFAKGDILGYTGASGAGPPHLHAEIRTGKEAAVAVDPLLGGWDVADDVAPTIPGLRVEPAEPGVLVDGGVDPAVLPLGSAPSGRSVSITGPVRLWLEAEDRAAGEGYRLLPYRVGFSIDGVPRCEVVFDAFDWNRAREVEWTFDASRERLASEPWIRLEAPPGVPPAVCRGITAGDDWTRDLAVGAHRLGITAADAAGNRTAADVALERRPAIEAGSRISTQVTSTEIDSKENYLELRLKGRTGVEGIVVESPEGAPLDGGWTVLEARGGAVAQLGPPDPPQAGMWTFSVHTAGGDSLLGQAVWTGRQGTARALWSRFRGPSVTAGDFRLRLDPEVPYRETWITVRREPAPPAPGANQGDLVPRSGKLLLGPWALPLHKNLEVAWAPDGLASRRGLALYSWDDGGWRFEGADTSGDGVSAQLSSLETMAVLEDTTPPAIGVHAPGGAPVRELTASVRDRGAGVSASGVRMLVDGRPVIAEWDPEGHRVTGHLRAALTAGAHEVTVEATDRVGNRARASRRVAVP